MCCILSSMMKSRAALPGIPNHQHGLLLTPHHWHCHGSMTQDHLLQMLSTWHCQKFSSSLMLCHPPHFISSCRHFIISHCKKKGEYSTIRYFERDHIHINFITVYHYNCSILLLVTVVNLLPCLIYKLHFIIGMYISEKSSIYRVWYYLRFQASTGGLGTYPFGDYSSDRRRAEYLKTQECAFA